MRQFIETFQYVAYRQFFTPKCRGPQRSAALPDPLAGEDNDDVPADGE